MTLDELFDDVLEIVSHLGAAITHQLEPFLSAQVESIQGSRADVLTAVAELAPTWFRSVENPPEWIQEAEWPVEDGIPMVFLGQVPISRSAGLFHDDAAVFVFIGPNTGVTSLVQVA